MSQSGILTSSENNPLIPTSFVTDSGGPVQAIANTIVITGAGGATTTGAGDVITITAGGGGGGALTWQAVTSASNPVILVKNNGYIAKGSGIVNFVLPASAALGDNYFIKGYGNLWTLSQNASQSFTLGTATTTVGVSGSVSATQVQDSINILCVTTNTQFDALDSIGNLTFV